MATSKYFNHFPVGQSPASRMLEGIVTESIKIQGHDCYYLPREAWAGDDKIFGENTTNKFGKAYIVEMYITNVEGYEGEGDIFSKFGLEIRNTSNFIVSRRSFTKHIPSSITVRPREGDLIYVPVLQKIFEVKFVEEELMFRSLGNRNPYIYEMRCEQFRYNNEDMDTGIEEIDEIEHHSAYTKELSLNNGTGNYQINETVYQGTNLTYATASAEVNDWTPSTKKLLVMSIKGQFEPAANVIGVTSGTIYNVSAVDALGDFVPYDLSDNKDIQSQANNVIVVQTNPFGAP